MRIFPDSLWKEGVDYEFRIWNPSLQQYRSVRPTIWHQSDVGSLNIVFDDSTSQAAKRTTQMLLQTEAGRMIADTSFVGSMVIDELAPVDHQLILYQDLNGNGEWDAGQVSPFKSPEPYYVRNDIPVQSGFTSDLSVSFDQ